MKIKYYILLFHFIFADPHQYPSEWEELQNNINWELIKSTERIKIYSKQIEGYPLPAYRAELISSLDKELLMNAAWNVENSIDVFPNAYIVDAGIYNWTDKNRYTAFQVFDIPFLSPRLYQFNSYRLENSIHWTKTDTIKNSKNIILPPVNFGSWDVKNDGRFSILSYRLCTDPGGKVPLWIVKQANQHYLPQMLLDLENFAKKINEN